MNVGMDAPPQREKEVSRELMELQGVIGDAQGAANNLCESLASVLRIDGPGAIEPGNKSAPQPVVCPLADQLRTMREGLQRTVRLIESMRGRLEV